jgi:hypothetical protein
MTDHAHTPTISYFHVCSTYYKYGRCSCFEDVVVIVEQGGGRWWYWHDGVLVGGKGRATANMIGRPVCQGEIGKTAKEIARKLGVK